MGTDFAGQRQELKGCFQFDVFWRPFFWNGLTRGFLVLFGDLAALDVGAEAAFVDPDVVAFVGAEHFALGRDRAFGFSSGRAEGAGVAAFGVVGTADKRAAGAGCAHGEATCAAVRAEARIAAFFGWREEMRFENFVNFFKNFGDAKIGGFFDGGFCGLFRVFSQFASSSGSLFHSLFGRGSSVSSRFFDGLPCVFCGLFQFCFWLQLHFGFFDFRRTGKGGACGQSDCSNSCHQFRIGHCLPP